MYKYFELQVYLFRKMSWGIVPIAIVIGMTAPIHAYAATLYWVGNDGADTSVASNWKTTNPTTCGSGNASAAPSTSDTAVFDADCDNGANINETFSVTSMTLSSGYAGTVTLHADVTISSTLTQDEGTLILNGQTLNTRTLTISGGTFTAGTGTLLLSGAASTINVNSTLTLYNLTINGTTATTKTISSSDTLIVTNTLTLTDGLVSQSTIPAAGTIRAQGAIVQSSTFDGGTARIVIDGTSDQVFTGNSTRTEGLLPLVRIDKLSGTLTLSGTIRTASHWNFSGGTLAYTDSTVIFSNAALTIRGSHSLSNVIFDQNSVTARTYTIASDTTLTVLGTLTLDNSTDSTSAAKITINGGIIRARGDISLPDNVMNHTGTTNLIIDGTGDQLLSGNAANSTGGLIALNIDKASGTLTLSGTIRTAKTWSYSGGTIDPGTSTVVFGATLTVAGSHTLGNVRFDGYKTAMTVTITPETTLIVSGLTLDQTADAGIITINGGIIRARGDISLPDNVMNHTGTTNLVIDGTASQLFSGNATNSTGGFLALNINKASGTLTLSGTIRTIKTWSYSGGTIDPGSSSVVFTTTTAAYDNIAGSHTLYNVSFVGVNRKHTISTGSTLTVNGTLALDDGFVDIGKIKANGGVTHAVAFDGGSGIIEFAGTATRTIALGVGTGSRLPGIILSGANTTITTGTASVVMFGSYVQSAGTFTGGTGTGTIHGGLDVTGGTFTPPTTLILDHAGQSPIINTSSTFTNLTLTDGLYSYWKLDEGTGVVPQDSSSRALSGATFFDAPAWSTDVPTTSFDNDYSLSFDGVDDYVGLPYTTSLSGLTDFTASAFVKTTATSGYIIAMRDTAANNVGAKQWTFNLSSGAPSCRVDPSDSDSPGVTSTVAINDGEWHHVACVRKNFRGYVYVDGVLTGEMSSGEWVKSLQNTVRIYLGANQRDNGSYLLGSLDDVRIYDRALRVDELSQLASGEEGRKFTLGHDLTVTNTLTLSRVTLDRSRSCYDMSYGTLVNTGGTLMACSSTSSSTTSTTSTTTISTIGTSVSRGGHRGSNQAMAQKIAAAKGLILAQFNQDFASAPPEVIEDAVTGKISLKELSTKQGTTTVFALRGRVAMAQGMIVLVYRDLPVNEWFTPFVSSLIEEKIAEGYKDSEGNLTGEFGVSNSVTYAEILKLALEAVGKTPDKKAGPPRNASAKGSWAEGYTKLADDLGISVIRPETNVHGFATRGEVIRILLEVLDIPVGSSVRLPYKDVPKNHPHALAIDSATYFGLIEGDKDSKGNALLRFRPDEVINRAEVAKIIALAMAMHNGQ